MRFSSWWIILFFFLVNTNVHDTEHGIFVVEQKIHVQMNMEYNIFICDKFIILALQNIFLWSCWICHSCLADYIYLALLKATPCSFSCLFNISGLQSLCCHAVECFIANFLLLDSFIQCLIWSLMQKLLKQTTR